LAQATLAQATHSFHQNRTLVVTIPCFITVLVASENMQSLFVFCACCFTVKSYALRVQAEGATYGVSPVEPWFNIQNNASRHEQYQSYLFALEGMLNGSHDVMHSKQRRGKSDNRSKFAVFQVGCGVQYCTEMIDSMTSLAVQYKDGEWDLWCVVDDVCSDILDRDQLHIKYSCSKLHIRDLVYTVDLFAHCASARLWVPQVLTQYKHFLYMDSDAIATNSIEPALRQMEEHTEVGIFMAEEVVSATCPGCGEYASRQAVRAGVNGYNSGVLGINSDVWINAETRDHILWILEEAKEGKFQLRMGDQDVLNLLAKRGILTLQDFPCEFNVRYEADCKNGSDWGTPVVLHGSRQMFRGRWKHAHHMLMRQANTMVYAWADDQRLATSLWEGAQLNFSDLYDDCAWDRQCSR